MIQYAWLIPILPLIGFLILGLFNKRIPKSLAGILASGIILASFIIAVTIFLGFLNGDNKATTINLFDWINSGTLHISFSFLIDQLSLLMILIITGVGFLIHVYSIGYMHDDEGFNRFFAYLNLFVFSMLLLVLGSNYVIMFIGWEGVGLCSYLLIGFWFKNQDYNDAAKKAFIMNRIGDLGFLLGIFLIYSTFGSTNYSDVFESAKGFASGDPILVAITLLLFVGAIGKSAQIPLYTWLPDAMAGPTPVSALIHAATMVTAGIYMIARSNILYTLAPITQTVVLFVGLITALLAATIGLFQNDIKKVLAYSTVSQLGYMFVALGVGGYTSAMFHLTTHAFFKALLFLCAGSVIHAMSGEQDIRRMGGLRKYLPITFMTFLIGTLAITGVPPFAGFFSKDEILAITIGPYSNLIFIVLSFTSVLTALYMFRVFFLTFYGTFRGTEKQQHHLHESPKSITIPLVILAILSTLGGFLGMPAIMSNTHFIKQYLAPVFDFSTLVSVPEHPSDRAEYIIIGVAIVVLAIIIIGGINKYIKRSNVPPADDAKVPAIRNLIYHKYYIDEFYNAIIVRPINLLGRLFHEFFESELIDGIVNSVGNTVIWSSKKLRYLQSGAIGFYVFAMVAGIVIILLYNYLK